jgi:hypothetical protein
VLNSLAGMAAKRIFSVSVMKPEKKGKKTFRELLPSLICVVFQFLLLGFLKVHKIEIFYGFDFEICIISLLVMSKY